MIKFFRKIRYNLMETGKTGKYLKYAIGEIVLVVIGILIALQINNWNEDRKSIAKGETYINEIYKDLHKDVLVITQIIGRLKEQSLSSERVLRILESPEQQIKDSLLFTNDFSLSSWPLTVERDGNTFSELTKTGQSAMIRNDTLIEKLHEFYKNYDSTISNFNEFPKEVRLEKRSKQMVLGNLNDFKYNVKTGKLHSGYINAIFLTPELYSTTLGIYKSCHYNIGFFEELLSNSREVISYIEKNHPNQIK